MKTIYRAVDEDNVLKTNASNEKSDAVSTEKTTHISVIEAEHAVKNRDADKSMRKRTSEFDSGDGASATKRTRIENCYSENSESVPECDKESGNVFGKGTYEETDKAMRVQRQESDGKAFSEDGETISVVDKESIEDKEISGVEKEAVDKDTSKDSEGVNSCSKRAHEPVDLIEVEKFRISPDMEKQLKISEGENSSAERPQYEGEEKQEPVKPVPPLEPKSNLDPATEHVATRLTDEYERTKSPEPAQKLNPMAFMRNLDQNFLKKLSRNELEEFVAQKLCEIVTDRRNLGDLRQKCQTLEQMVDHWRKEAHQLQKQVMVMEMLMRRYIGDACTTKELPIPVKVTNSVTLQVHTGPLGPDMLRNRTLGSDSQGTPGQVKQRCNRVSPPPVAAPVQQHQQQQQGTLQQPQQLYQQQQQQTQPVVRTPTTIALTKQKLVTPSPVAALQPVVIREPNTMLSGPIPASLKMASSPTNIVVRRTFSIATTAVTKIGSMISTANTVNNTAVNTTTNLTVPTVPQLKNRQQPKPSTVYSPNKPNANFEIIDLTDD
jgi:hypothetical protein